MIVATSNRMPDDLYKDGLNRALFLPFIALLKEKLVVYELASPTDYRQDRLRGQQVWFTPLGAASTAALDGLWTALAGGAGAPLTLQVTGRDVVIPAYRGGVGANQLSNLCGAALGAADYLAISAALRVILLDDIPVLDPTKANEARRFVTLIDTLYEAQRKLIASAAAPAADLYRKGAGTFEFNRTISRLHEMQADGWGD